jgi:SMI1-KNR4 cell-wall
MVTIEDLVALVPPPVSPVDAIGDWAAVEAAIGVRLPTDFKALISRYGAGEFNGLIRPLTPFDPETTLIDWSNTLDNEGSFRDLFPEQCPYPFYPEPGGLLTWATTSDGAIMYWLTDGEPDDWKVVAYDYDGYGYEPQDVGTVAFLYEWLSGTRPVALLRPPVPVPWFTAHTPHDQHYFRLTDSDLPYEQRLQVLRECLAPTADRLCVNHNGVRQDGFDAPDRDWWLMYENACGHQIRVAFPPGDDAQVHDAIYAAATRMGCQVHDIVRIHPPE